MKKIVFDNYKVMSRAAADIVAQAVRAKSDIVLGLPTGSTPVGMYDELAKDYAEGKVDFSKAVSFNLDEYAGLDGAHPQSYRYFMEQHLFGRVNIARGNTHVPDGVAKDLDKAAKEFDAKIFQKGGIDLFVLGIGQNGHIGFNEPAASMPAYTHVVELAEDTIAANSRLFDDISEVPKRAVTQGLATIMQAKKIILLSSGPAKREAIAKIDSGIITLDCPATVLHMHRDITLLLC